MQLLVQNLDLKNFFERLTEHQQKILLLDYDGTLSPFSIERDKAFPYPGVSDILDSIRSLPLARVIIITGRALQDLAPLLNLDPLPEIWASHGWEHLSENGQYTLAFPSELERLMSEAKRKTNALSLNAYIEQKPTSIAFHWRGLPIDLVEPIKKRILDTWKTLVVGVPLKIHEFDGGIELRILGKDKGTATNSILRNIEGPYSMAYLGDDFTDEDAFNVLKGKALNVLVRREYRPTNADLWIKPPEELLWFLSEWRKACSSSD